MTIYNPDTPTSANEVWERLMNEGHSKESFQEFYNSNTLKEVIEHFHLRSDVQLYELLDKQGMKRKNSRKPRKPRKARAKVTAPVVELDNRSVAERISEQVTPILVDEVTTAIMRALAPSQ